MNDPWDPDRVSRLGKIMDGYAPHLHVNMKLDTRVQGDPYRQHYRGEATDTSATVTDILERREDGLVRFEARMNETGETFQSSNRDIGNPWEMHPDYMSQFQEYVKRGTIDSGNHFRSSDQMNELTTQIEELKHTVSSMSTRIDELKDESVRYGSTGNDQHTVEEEEYRATMAKAVRALAGDIYRAAHGQDLVFTSLYMDRYDQATVEEDDYQGANESRGGEQLKSSDRWNVSAHATSMQSKDDTLSDDEELTPY